ncbi:MAG: ATP-dependent Clp protease ATP-binding subunit ClpC, partial [Acidobacteriota bacterium]|nr:ATP-dependent Clp protease ATP-binding subunit ClpC [Acidobacteriota bacterium]
MTQLIIAGLVLLCLLSVGVVAYLSRALARLRRALEEEMRSPRLLSRDVQPEATLRDTTATPETPPLISPGVTSGTDATDAASGANATNEEVDAFVEPAPIATNFGLANTAATLAAATETPTVNELNIYSIAQALDTHYQQSGRPAELRQHEYFHKGVKLLEGYYYTTRDLIEFARESNVVVACMALEALGKRSDATGAVEMILAHINEFYYWPGYYALQTLDRCSAAERPVLASLLLHLKGAWGEYTALQSLREFVTSRTEHGEREATFGDALYTLTPDQIELLTNIFDALKDVIPTRLLNEFESWKEARVDLEFLRSFGRVWKFDAGADDGAADTDSPEGVLLLEEVRERVLEMETAVRKAPPRSVLLVGDSGVGKTALVRVLARRLQRERWIILEASAADVMAGQQYIGQLEGRVQTLVREIGGKRVLWVVPNFHELAWAGRHQYNPSGLLDLLLPHVESGAVRLIGEVPSAAYEKLMQMRPKLRTALETCRVNALGDEETLEVARRWAAGQHRAAEAADGTGDTTRPAATTPCISEQTLQEAFQLAKQYLADKAAPGNLLLLLDSTHRRLLIERGSTDGSATNGTTTNGATNAAATTSATTTSAVEVTLDDLLVTLSQLTGLPVSILDDRAGLDLGDLRGFFEQRVLGQPEAVECLVERVAMIKAGLTDPTRPQGVFLFVGPTGTGKTEIAKTLAEFLFGSPERMIRLDMSEFQTPDALDRILGEQRDSAAAAESTALVNSIRKQPFAVVLLDEFEKAHPQVWDLFLQVFDDGRLTDRRGNTADFRHCVVIMTSNLGATLPHGASIGFSQEQAQFAAGAVERAVMRAFRREFVNRIDRVVVFRPLGRSIMRDLLRKELNDVLRRRGLRTRQWAVEWDESAIDFLLEKGFTADLGARPLKRAIERYLLSPLALTIVNHQFPEGDQFLFVHARTGQSLDVEFVDPDAPDALPGQAARAQILDAPDEDAPDAGARELRLESIVLDARGTLAEVQFLQDHFDALADQVDGEEWQGRKNSALLETSAPGFWNSPERFAVLGLAEYMDRIETGLDTAGSLLKRLNGSRTRDRQHFPADLVARLAHQLYLLDAACRGLAAGHPRDLFLQVRASCDAGADNALCDDFARRISGM